MIEKGLIRGKGEKIPGIDDCRLIVYADSWLESEAL